jgi:hypothetical protein
MVTDHHDGTTCPEQAEKPIEVAYAMPVIPGKKPREPDQRRRGKIPAVDLDARKCPSGPTPAPGILRPGSFFCRCAPVQARSHLRTV